ncbi:serine hydrolase domain-containing protein [Gymnodinialimonas ceratoperidinii]|uniref:Beta-lactamase family protein n=1 Tax=Gymnodinialimonas ceratoperidinii TaxID=2856823 RepID=A0A8F6YAR1_9RHOB|nr:serine hydrolase domain-containing protein [Gymnodinialimonas ceratoperidinii]QXT39291.1 beta-lactamase family protein [Gymnodinialimonas ceratoperidinii]
MAQDTAQEIAEALAGISDVPAAAAGWVTAQDMDFGVAGTRVVNGSDRVQPDDQWHVGSITKGMTATLAARLVEAGAITWDTRLGAVLGDSYPDMHPDWHDTPLRRFLTHRSGMAANLPDDTAAGLGTAPRRDYVAEALFAAPIGAPGEFVYSNAGYVVAGAILEAAGGASWEELMRIHVFAPLGMESAGFGPPQGAVIEGHSPRLLWGVSAAGQSPEADNIPAMGPAGRVHLSAADMLRYLRAHLLRDETFLSTDAWETLHAPIGEEAYAMGWGVGEDGSLVHSGSNTLWYAVAYVAPDSGRAVFVSTNTGDFDAVVEPVDEALRSLLEAR